MGTWTERQGGVAWCVDVLFLGPLVGLGALMKRKERENFPGKSGWEVVSSMMLTV